MGNQSVVLTGSTLPAEKSRLALDEGSRRVDLELLSESDGGERDGDDGFSEHFRWSWIDCKDEVKTVEVF